MKIKDILKNGRVNVSCELSPPKELTSLANTSEIVAELAKLSPSFMSVTYGAAGTAAVAEKTIEVARQVRDNHVTALSHITCINATDEVLDSVLDTLKAEGIENVLALRGDIPAGYEIKENAKYRHASDLAAKIRASGDFCIGGACYPEGHVEAASRAEDIENLKKKVAAGCDFLTTQMFFDNNILYNFMFRLLKSGINVPIIAGIMPVVNAKQITRVCRMSGTALPQRFLAIVDRFGSDPASMRQAGIAYATEQIIDLIANGVTNIHLYTMNKPDIARSIMDNLSDIINHDQY